MNKTFIRFTALAALLLLCSCSSGKKSEKMTLVLDWTPNTNHTGIYTALDLGYYAEEGIELEIVQPPEDGALSLVAAGKADFGVSFEEEVLFAANAEPPLPVAAVAAILEHNTSGIISMKEKGIERFSDLEGKSYGSWQVPIYDEIVMECVRADGGDPLKIDFVPNSAMDSISGIMREFDAVWVYEGWDKVIADMRGLETNFMLFKDINPIFDYYTPVLVTNSNWLDDSVRLENAAKFLRATSRGYEYASKNPSVSAEILSKYAPETEPEILAASQQYMSGQYYGQSGEKWGYIDETRWNAFFDWMKEKGMLSPDAENKAFTQINY